MHNQNLVQLENGFVACRQYPEAGTIWYSEGQGIQQRQCHVHWTNTCTQHLVISFLAANGCFDGGHYALAIVQCWSWTVGDMH